MEVHRYDFLRAPVSGFADVHSWPAGNYDVSKMHYDGPGDIPGAPGHGYGYDIRVAGKSSADPPPSS